MIVLFRVAAPPSKKIHRLECRKYPLNRNGVAASQMQVTRTRLLSSMQTPTWLSASQSITLNPFSLLRRKASPQHTLRGASYFLLRQKVGKNHATRSLWQNPLYCPFFSTAGHTLTRDLVITGCSKELGLLTVCPLARRKKGEWDFATFAIVAVRGASWLLQRSPCSRAIIGYESLVHYSQVWLFPGVQGPAGP